MIYTGFELTTSNGVKIGVQLNLDYPDLDYPDYSFIPTVFSRPKFS